MQKILILLICSLLFTSCAVPTQTTANVSPTILDAAAPMAENLMVSLQNSDYASFIKDMDETMTTGTTDPSFKGLRETLIGKYGSYQSLEYKNVATTGEFVSVYYAVKFEKITLTMQLVLLPTEPHLISGLWFR